MVMGEQLENTEEQKGRPSLQDHVSMWTSRRGRMMKMFAGQVDAAVSAGQVDTARRVSLFRVKIQVHCTAPTV